MVKSQDASIVLAFGKLAVDAEKGQQVQVDNLTFQALDRTIFLHRSKKSTQKLAKPLNSLKDLAYTIDEIFVLAYPSQVVNTNVMNSVPTWEESLINLDYLLAWACPHLKLIKSKHSGCATVNSLNVNPSGLNGELSHSYDHSQSELKSEIGVNPSSLLDFPGKIYLASNQTRAPGSDDPEF
ncbi:hypothetical protein DSO57_1025493 [Entomophthora muscae]|uniref:Uncharacterized protein n=1 Tax=Entomophthora muscae TaxID=34485 RepID=A0ACC2TPU2_9FUNG|nr:hypothetical protein DSO57_1025493 [Entomophthora muscae]